MYDVIALGELLVDLAERSKDEAGYPTLAANPGGAPGNFLAALSAYGKKTAFLAKVGDDTFGRLLVGTMQRAGIDGCGIRIDPDTFTTLAFVTFDAHGDRSFAFARKPGADTQLRWDEIDPAMLDETHVFHFGSAARTSPPAARPKAPSPTPAPTASSSPTTPTTARRSGRRSRRPRSRSSGACGRRIW